MVAERQHDDIYFIKFTHFCLFSPYQPFEILVSLNFLHIFRWTARPLNCSSSLMKYCYVFNDNEMPPVVITPSLLLYSQTCHVMTCDAQGFPSENFS